MTTKYQLALTFVIAILLFVTSCKKDDPVIPNEEEIITSLTYRLIPENGGDEVAFIFQDFDGEGGNAPVIIQGMLEANTMYEGTLELLNETVVPAADISKEIQEEGEDHQFFFEVANDLDLTISYNDLDANGNPLGLSTAIATGNASQGQLTIILRHEPDKAASGVADGDITNAGGETDIEVTFDLSIQ